jgi:hypothetical protein
MSTALWKTVRLPTGGEWTVTPKWHSGLIANRNAHQRHARHCTSMVTSYTITPKQKWPWCLLQMSFWGKVVRHSTEQNARGTDRELERSTRAQLWTKRCTQNQTLKNLYFSFHSPSTKDSCRVRSQSLGADTGALDSPKEQGSLHALRSALPLWFMCL